MLIFFILARYCASTFVTVCRCFTTSAPSARACHYRHLVFEGGILVTIEKTGCGRIDKAANSNTGFCV